MSSTTLRTRRVTRCPMRTTPHITPAHHRVHIRTKVLLHHTLEAPLLGHAGIILHLGQMPKLGGGIPTSHSFIYRIQSILCTSTFLFLSSPFVIAFQNTKRLKIFLLLLFTYFFSWFALLPSFSYYSKIQKDFALFPCFFLFLS